MAREVRAAFARLDYLAGCEPAHIGAAAGPAIISAGTIGLAETPRGRALEAHGFAWKGHEDERGDIAAARPGRGSLLLLALTHCSPGIGGGSFGSPRYGGDPFEILAKTMKPKQAPQAPAGEASSTTEQVLSRQRASQEEFWPRPRNAMAPTTRRWHRNGLSWAVPTDSSAATPKPRRC